MPKSLNDFLITRRWPAKKPDQLQLYSLATPNGVKVSIALEELKIPYEVHKIDINADDQFTAEFLSVNPNNKIPAIVDPNGPGGQPLALFETGAILIYLSEKSGGKLVPQDQAGKYQALQWLMWQMGGVGPMFGQLGYFHKFAGREIADERPRERYAKESRRLLSVLDQQLIDKDWVLGNGEAAYSIADIAIFPWVRNLVGFYGAADLVGWEDFKEVRRVLEVFLARAAVQRGLATPA